MNRDTLGFVVSIGLLFFAYMGINHYYVSKSVTEAPATVSAPAAPSTAVSSPVPTPALAAAEMGALVPTPTPVPALPTALAPDQLTIENESLRAQFDQRGGCIGPVHLKSYRAALDADEAAELKENYSLCKLFGTKLNGADQRGTLMFAERLTPQRIEFRSPAQDDVEVIKTLDFSPGTYRATLAVTVRNVGAQNRAGNIDLELGATSDVKPEGWFSGQSLGHEFLEFSEDKIHRHHLAFQDTPQREVIEEKKQISPLWMGTSSLYFLTALLPKTNAPVDVSLVQTGFNLQRSQSTPPDRTVFEAWVGHRYQLMPGASQSWEYDVYMGPKIKEQLDVFKDKKLSQAIDYGFFEIVAWPIFYALKAIHKVVNNWGWAIIILTVAIKFLLYPLTKMAYIAGKKMQKVQPQLQAIREKYKDDKMKLNQETMALMSQTGTNPLSGCLPVLPTIPVFFALFSVLQHSFELRHAPFMFWIRDLSTMDPLFITPVALALSYYIQQRLTPMPTMDPAQAKMMQFLPLIFAVFMLTFPSGLVIYSLVNSVMTMIQQQYMMRKYKDV